MATQIDALIKLRRGPDSERQLINFDSGEIVFSTDIKRVFIGNGDKVGGYVIGNLNTIGTVPSPSALQHDLFYQTSTNTLYMLTAFSRGADLIENYARLIPEVDGTTIKLEDGKYKLSNDFIYDTLDTRYVNVTGDTMTGSLCINNTNGNSLEVNKPIKVDYITSTETLSIQKPTIQILNNYSEVVSSIDVNSGFPYATINLNKANNFILNLYSNLSGFNITNCPSEGASFTTILKYKSNNLKIDWKLRLNGGSFVIPKWQMGKLPITSKTNNSEDAFAFVYMAGQWYCFISGVDMLAPTTTVT
jgi:hypothetical protein